MAEDVVEVAGDAFALGYSGEGFDFFLLEAEFAIAAFFLRDEKVGAPANDREEEREEHC